MGTKTKLLSRKRLHDPYLNFEYLLKEKGVSYKYLSGVLHVSISTVSDKINGWSDFTFEEVTTICDDLNCSSCTFT